MLEFALSQETARTAPLLPPVEGREENPLFRFVSVPPVPTYSKKEQFPFSGPWDDSVRRSAFSLPPTTHFASSQESMVRGRCTSPRTSSQSRLGPREFGKLLYHPPLLPFTAPPQVRRLCHWSRLHSVWRCGSRCPACLAGSRAQFDSATRFSSPGDLPSSTAFSRHRWQSGTPLFSALATLPGPEVGMAPRYTLRGHHPAVSPLPQPLDRPCLFTGWGAPRTSVPAYCCHNRCLQHGLGHHMQWAGSLGALDRAPTALAHQLPRAVGSASSLTAVPATAVGQAHVSPHEQHCGCLIHQPVGRYTITSHVTARPPSPPLESHAVHIPGKLNSAADALSRQLTFPEDRRLHPETIRLIWSRFEEAQVDLFASHESSHYQLYFSLTEGPLSTDALAHS